MKSGVLKIVKGRWVGRKQNRYLSWSMRGVHQRWMRMTSTKDRRFEWMLFIRPSFGICVASSTRTSTAKQTSLRRSAISMIINSCSSACLSTLLPDSLSSLWAHSAIKIRVPDSLNSMKSWPSWDVWCTQRTLKRCGTASMQMLVARWIMLVGWVVVNNKDGKQAHCNSIINSYTRIYINSAWKN